MMNLLVTGGCGFIGSNFIKYILETKSDVIDKVINVDCLTYAADIKNTRSYENNLKYFFEEVDLCDLPAIREVFTKYDVTHIVHLAAESHVDNSIEDPTQFIDSNIIGTFNLLKIAHELKIERFHHVSTDEVYGDLEDTGKFNEDTPYDPHNPYSASKAASDFLVKSYFHTYKTPITISNCSNNYGPHQHKEKFIPTIINSILNERKIPLYGKGLNVRDWIYVEDHCDGIWKVFMDGVLGETYCIGANCEKKNINVIKAICRALKVSPKDYIEYVKDRKGHDFRYAIDNGKISKELGWSPKWSFNKGIKKTIEWYNEKN